MSEKNKEIVAKVDAAFAEGSIEGFLVLCAEDVEWTMVGEKNVKGKDAIRKWMTSMDSEPPKFTVKNVMAADCWFHGGAVDGEFVRVLARSGGVNRQAFQ